jgi:hypothetical protein
VKKGAIPSSFLSFLLLSCLPAMDNDEQIDLDLNQPINWEEIDEEYNGDVFGLNYVYVFEESDDGKLKLYSRIYFW